MNISKRGFFSIFFYCCVAFVWAQEPTPVEINMSPEGGFFQSAITVEISSNYPSAAIYYTLDGSSPSSSTIRYRGALTFDTTTIIRAIAYHDGMSAATGGSFFFGEDSTNFPVFSVAIEPNFLFNSSTGVFKRGPRASPNFPHKGANYYSKKEVKCHVEFFETDKERVMDAHVGFRVFGGMSRIFPQKSFSLSARKSRYGTKRMKHQFFPDKEIPKFKHLVLRNSGSDFGGTHFRDAMITSLGREMGLEVQGYRPCLTFINGEYWGIYNIREKLTPNYIKENFGIDKDSIDMMEHRKGVKNGSRAHYERMQNYMRNNDLAEQRHFDTVATMMDVENFMEYEIVQIYIHNGDAGGNIKFWRPQTPDGKWRWILFDTDFGFGHDGGIYAYKKNSLEFHTEPHGPGWPNPPWSTFNLRMLLKNEGFQREFVQRFADRMNSTFEPNYVLARIDSMANYIMPELPRHWQRWRLSGNEWEKRTERMREFARQRPMYMREHLQKMFPFIGEQVKFSIGVEGNGIVQLNEVISITDTFNGVYFQNLPVDIIAKPRFGYQFSHWEDEGLKVNSRTHQVKFLDTIHTLKAVFVKGEHPMAARMIINELSCSDTLSGDWVELFNSTNEALNVEGWQMKDAKGNTFIFPNIEIAPNDFLVVCKDTTQLKRGYPNARRLLGGLNFGLSSKKESLELYDAEGMPVDSIGYKIPKEFRDKQFVLNLKDYGKDNANSDNWKLIEGKGSPASINPDYIELNRQKQMGSLLYYIKIGAISVAVFVAVVVAYTLLRRKAKPRGKYK